MTERKRLGVIEKTLLIAFAGLLVYFAPPAPCHYRALIITGLTLRDRQASAPGKFSTAYNKQNDLSAYHPHYAAG